jgi:hypothetical protein
MLSTRRVSSKATSAGHAQSSSLRTAWSRSPNVAVITQIRYDKGEIRSTFGDVVATVKA